MKLIQHLRYCQLINESCAPGSLFRIMHIEELANIIESKGFKLADNTFENADIDDNSIENTEEDASRLRTSEVYKRNKEYPYSKCFARSLAPNLLRNFFDEKDSVIVEFDKAALSNLRNTKIVPIDYQPYGKAHRRTRELEDRLYSKSEYLNFPGGKIPEQFKDSSIGKRKNRLARLIKRIYFGETLAKELQSGIDALRRVGIDVQVISDEVPKSKRSRVMVPRDFEKLTVRGLKEMREKKMEEIKRKRKRDKNKNKKLKN